MSPQKLCLILSAFLFTACGAVDKVTNTGSLDRAKDETRREKAARYESEREASDYRYMLLRAEKTTNHLWVFRVTSFNPSRAEAEAECKDLLFSLPTRAMLDEAKENANLAKLLTESNLAPNDLYVADEADAEGKWVSVVLCVR